MKFLQYRKDAAAVDRSIDAQLQSLIRQMLIPFGIMAVVILSLFVIYMVQYAQVSGNITTASRFNHNFKDEVDLWPFQIAIGKYKATVDGHYNLNTVGEYHISVTESPLPTRLGLKISGPLNDLSYKLEPCKYPHLYKPNRRSDTEQMVLQLKNKIAERLKATVRE